MTTLLRMNESSGYRRYVLIILMLVYAFNFIDRQLLVILQESIKKELLLSDTQLGLLTGFAFAMFYVTLGIPLARLADKSNRRNIVAISLSLWSGVTALTGLCTNFFQLVAARIGVGIGEAGCSPQSHAIISDYYPVEKRASALSIYSLGIYVGIFIGYLGGGILNQWYGWRIAFFAMGVPGILLALLLFLTVREPVRGASDAIKKEHLNRSLWEVIRYLLTKKSFIYLSLGAGFMAFVQYGIGNWLPSFLYRYFAMQSKEIGIANALLVGIGGGIGTVGGGYLCDYLGRKSRNWYLWIPMIAIVLTIPLVLLALFASEKAILFTLIFPGIILNAMYLAPSVAIAHALVPPTMRAMASSVLFFILNIIGLGGGPLAVGILSDSLKSIAGDQALRYGMASIVAVGFLASGCYFIASRSLKEELER